MTDTDINDTDQDETATPETGTTETATPETDTTETGTNDMGPNETKTTQSATKRCEPDLATLRRIEEFLYREAGLLDRPNLDEWIQLYTEDGTYWMPAIEDQADPLNHISLMYDDRVMMEIRRRNFVHPRAASKDYTVRQSHLIGNVRIIAMDEDTGDCTVHSNFQCASYYADQQTLYAGTYRHELVNTANGYRIRHKRVNLINCDAVLGTIIIYL